MNQNIKSEKPSAIWGFQWINKASEARWQDLNSQEGYKFFKPIHYLGYRAVSLVVIPCNLISLVISLFGMIIMCPCRSKKENDGTQNKFGTYFADRFSDSWKILKNHFVLPCEIYFLFCKTPSAVSMTKNSPPQEKDADKEFLMYKTKVGQMKVHLRDQKQYHLWNQLLDYSAKVESKEASVEEIETAKSQYIERSKELILDAQFEACHIKLHSIVLQRNEKRELNDEKQQSEWKLLTKLGKEAECKESSPEEAKKAKIEYIEKAEKFMSEYAVKMSVE